MSKGLFDRFWKELGRLWSRPKSIVPLSGRARRKRHVLCRGRCPGKDVGQRSFNPGTRIRDSWDERDVFWVVLVSMGPACPVDLPPLSRTVRFHP